MEKITGKTSSGFEFSISGSFKNDWRYIKAIRDARSKDPMKQVDGLCDMITYIFNDEAQEERFYQHLSEHSEDGTVKSEVIWKEVEEILASIGDTKN